MSINITAIHLVGGEKHEHIQSVQWRDRSSNETGQATRATMVDWIGNKGGSAFVKDNVGSVPVLVVDAKPPYIRTKKDDRWTDNLLALPQY